MEERRILRMEREGAYMRSTKYIPEVYTRSIHLKYTPPTPTQKYSCRWE